MLTGARLSVSRWRGLLGGLAALGLATAGLATAAGCGPDTPEATPASAMPDGVPSAATTEETEARLLLAARAAAAEDLKTTALYTLSVPGHSPRTVTVITAVDGSWRVDIPGGAVGGLVDVSVAQNPNGLYQCALPSASRNGEGRCVRVAASSAKMPTNIDPRVQHPFTDWRQVLTDRRAPLAVSNSAKLPNVSGRCFSVESTYASLTAPLDAGIYCFAENGTLTGAKLSFGTLTLSGTPTPGPASVTLPGRVVVGPALGMATPTPPAGAAPGASTTASTPAPAN